MRRVRWQNGEVVAAEHFLELENWVLGQVSGGRLGEVGMGLLSGGIGGGDAKSLRTFGDGRRTLCGPLRALTSSGSLLVLDEATEIELDRDSIGSDWSTLFLLIGQAGDDRDEVPDSAELQDQGPVIALPALRLSTRVSAGVDCVPVARIRKQAKNLVLDDAYLAPSVLVDGQPRLAGELAKWRELVEQVGDLALAFASRWQGRSQSAVDVQAMTFVWMTATTAAAALDARVLTCEAFFRSCARFGSDVLRILRHFRPAADNDGNNLVSVVERLARFDALDTPDFAVAVDDSKVLRVALRQLVQVEDPGQPAIELSGPPAVTRETQPARWKVVLPLTRPLGESVQLGGRVLVALRLRSGRDADVRVHPTKPWATIGQSNIVRTFHDMQAKGLDGRFNGYFTYVPAADELRESRIVFQLLEEPVLSDRNSVALEVVQ